MGLESYNGSVSLISGIKQANNGTFPLIEANAVQVDEGGTRLDAKLTEMQTQIENAGSGAKTATVTIASSDWSGGTTVTKSVAGVTASSIIICDSSDGSVECTAQGAGTLTFTASTTPSATVTIKVVIL